MIRLKTDNLVYDFSIIGYDPTIIKALGGTPSASGTKLRLNASEACTYGFFRYGHFEFVTKIVTAPTAGHVRAFGLKAPGLGDRGRIEFEVADTTFRVVVYDNAGTVVISTAVTWNAAWTNTEKRYGVTWARGMVKFYVEDVEICSLASSSVPSLPLALHVNNAVAEAQDSAVWMAQGAESFN